MPNLQVFASLIKHLAEKAEKLYSFFCCCCFVLFGVAGFELA